jgi:hypothetical protein
MNTSIEWDTTYVWNVTNNSLPILRMGSIYPAEPSGEYFRRDLAQKDMGNEDTFVHTFASDVVDQNIKLLDDMDVTSGWTPVNVTNSTIDGNGKTIIINLNNANGGMLGLFKTLDNVTIKNLNILVKGVSSNATNAGALAGVITSSDDLTNSTIENVNITFENSFGTPVITNFGGIAGTISKTNIKDCSINNIKVNSDSKISYVGSVAGVIGANTTVENITISNCEVCGITSVGGIAGTNAGNIFDITGDVSVKLVGTGTSYAGGIVAQNNGAIDDVNMSVKLTIAKVGEQTLSSHPNALQRAFVNVVFPVPIPPSKTNTLSPLQTDKISRATDSNSDKSTHS